jgi:hypothetical protein
MRYGWGNSLHAGSGIRGDTPTPTLPRKQEREPNHFSRIRDSRAGPKVNDWPIPAACCTAGIAMVLPFPTVLR